MPLCQTYETYMKDEGIPIYREYFVEDIRELELAPWKGRECNAAFLQLAGQEGVVEVRVQEIPPGKTLTPIKMGVDEAIYVAKGQGIGAVSGTKDGVKKTFEWGPHSLFFIPANTWYQLSNMSGSEPARLLHYNYLPIALTATPDLDFFINHPDENGGSKILDSIGGEFYSQAKAVEEASGKIRGAGTIDYYWLGNFFPDLKAWDRLSPYRGRGAGGRVIFVKFPTAEMDAHMSVFPSRTYKKGHRHGPGVVIIIPAGEGYSLMWPEGREKLVIPWREGSIFVPPNRWFHQHFNLGGEPARYLAFHAPPQLMMSAEKIEDAQRDQFEYPDEDPSIRQRFETELAKRGLTSLMPEQAYADRSFEWEYQASQDEAAPAGQ